MVEPVLLKCENLQRTGSFKIRGSYVRIARLAGQERGRGVIAASAGNHAQGVALAAHLLGESATVFMPRGRSIVKERATRGYGAQVEICGTTVDEALVAAQAAAEQSGATLIHPFDHPDVVAGQATVGLEVLAAVPDVGTILVPLGGGGLLAGVALAVRQSGSSARVVGVQAAGAAAYPSSLAAGHPVPATSMSTMADGIAVGVPGDLTFAMVSQLVDEVVTVTENALSSALLLLLERGKLVVEPAGAAAVAAVMQEAVELRPPVVVILSGGNIDPLLMLRVIRHGMAAEGRYQRVRIAIPDRPGELLAVMQILADADANVIDVTHERFRSEIGVGQVEVSVVVESRDAQHGERIVARLAQAGYGVAVA